MTGRALMTAEAAQHLARLLGMIGSDHDGEALNAARLADRFVKQLGLRWPDVIVVTPQWQAMAKLCRERDDLLSSKEAEFIANISRARRMPTDRQLQWLQAIYERIGGAA